MNDSTAIETELIFIAENLSEILAFPVKYYPGSSDSLHFFGPDEPGGELNSSRCFMASETAAGLLAISGAYMKGRRDTLTSEHLRGNKVA